MKLRHPLVAGAAGLAGALALANPARCPRVPNRHRGRRRLVRPVRHGRAARLRGGRHHQDRGGHPRRHLQRHPGGGAGLDDHQDARDARRAGRRRPRRAVHGARRQRDLGGRARSPTTSSLTFGLSVQVPDTPGETILFPVIQTCEGGAVTEWIQPTVEGEEEPEHPAPAITLTEAEGDGHGGGRRGGSDHHVGGRGRAGLRRGVRIERRDDDGPDAVAIAALDRRPGRPRSRRARRSPAAGRPR